ncbi:MAG: S-adenosylmethionine:tRNA ribosyltransferase-isomerase [Marinilabiliales bacterium]
MEQSKSIKIQDFSYKLPEHKIAKYPLGQRDMSKLLVSGDRIIDDTFKNISNYLPSKSIIFFNNTHVIRARMEFYKHTGARIEIFCLEPYLPSDYFLSFQSKKSVQWTCIIGNLKKWKNGSLSKLISIDNQEIELFAKIIKQDKNNKHIIEFNWDSNHTFSEIIDNSGKMPIPPYLKRESEEIDEKRYQTIYAKYFGSVAAPTAGLHFTGKTLESLRTKNIEIDYLTLHVGAGTFAPVKSDNVFEHSMHTEHFFVSKDNLENLINNKNKIIATGTTTLRTLESIYWTGLKVYHKEKNINIDQWYPYNVKSNISVKDCLYELINYMDKNNIDILENTTSLMIIPGYKFRLTDILITNFHQPKSTLLLLVAAFIGDDWKRIYEHALNNDYRFLSYGDSSLLFRKDKY